MATIASLAFQVQANIGDTVERVMKVAKSVNDMTRMVQRAPASLANLQQSSAGLSAALDALGNQQKRVAELQDDMILALDEGVGADAAVAAHEKYRAGLAKTEEAVRLLRDRSVLAADQMAADILNVVPAVENLDAAFQKLDDVKGVRAEFQMLTGDMDIMADAAEKGERMFDLFTTNAAAKLTELPPTVESLSKSLEFLHSVQEKTATFELLPPDAVLSVNATREAVKSLADTVAERIGELPATFGNLKAAIGDAMKVRELSEGFRSMTGGAENLSGAVDLAGVGVEQMARRMAAGLANVPPKLAGIRKACKEMQELKGLASDMASVGVHADAMNGIMKQAEENIAGLVAKTAQASIETAAFHGALLVANMPLLLLKGVLTEIWGEVQKLFQRFNEYFGGFPATVAKVTVALVGMLALIGYCASGTAVWGGMTTYLMALWKSNVIVVGLGKIATVIASLIGFQIGLNAVTFIYFGLIGGALALLVAAISLAVSWWYSASDATEKAAEKTKMLQDATEAYKNTLQGTVDEHKKMADLIAKHNEAAKSPAQKAADSQAELQRMIEEPKRLQQDIVRMEAEIDNRKKLIANTKDTEAVAELKARNEEAVKTLGELKEIQSRATPLTAEGAKHAQKEAAKAYAQATNLNIDAIRSADEVFNSQLDAIEIAINKNLMNFEQVDNALKNVVAEYRKAEGIDALVAPFKTAKDILDGTNAKLKHWLDEGVINAQEYANGLKRAFDKFKKDTVSELGIGSLITEKRDPFSQFDFDTTKLKTALDRGAITLEEYNIGLKNSLDSLKTGTEAGKMVAKAMELVTPATERLEERYTEIDRVIAEMIKRGESVTDETRERARELARKEIEGKSEASGKLKDNQALVRGSVAYADFLRRDSGKDHLKDIKSNTKKQVELAGKQVEATRELGDSFAQCFEVMGD